MKPLLPISSTAGLPPSTRCARLSQEVAEGTEVVVGAVTTGRYPTLELVVTHEGLTARLYPTLLTLGECRPGERVVVETGSGEWALATV